MFVIYVKISILAGKCLAWGPLYMLAIRRLPNKTFWMAPQNGQLASHWQVSPLEVLISCYIANLLYSLSTYYPILKSNMYIIYFLPNFFLLLYLYGLRCIIQPLNVEYFSFFFLYTWLGNLLLYDIALSNESWFLEIYLVLTNIL